MNNISFDHENFLKNYVLSRTSHKKSAEDLVLEAEHAWDFIQLKVYGEPKIS